jgi:hypothetical protein
MGDTGSLLLGLVNSILVIKFINLSTATNVAMPLEAAPAIGFAILMIPLADTLRVFSQRLLARRSPFSPDRNHIHHFLLDLGFSHRKITLTCVSVNILFIAMAVGLRHLGTTVVMAILFGSALLLISLVYFLRQKTSSLPVEEKAAPEVIKQPKIITLVTDSMEAE